MRSPLKVFSTPLLCLLVAVVPLGLYPVIATDGDECATLASENADRCLRLNQVQVLGSHNSYKRYPAPELVSLLDLHREGWSRDINYEHRPLAGQLGLLGLRQFELDVFADSEGGLFANPAGGRLVNDPEIEANYDVMLAPGLKVLHSQDVDYRSSCLSLKLCLSEIRDWSLQNPTHLPIMIMIELKDAARADWGPIRYTTPVLFSAENIHDVDREILQVFDRSHIVTPDDVRGQHETLEQAVLADGWPTLARSRGKVLFALDNTGRHREMYLEGAPVLQTRILFVSAGPGHPAAAFIKMNDVMADEELIRAYVAAGYLVRTRSDIPVQEAVSGDTTRRNKALTSGAQYISTDYAEVSPFGSGYQVVLPKPGRCNPVSAPAGCRDEFLLE
ncbi:MAG: Ca2+-dependent phosphoinositide-specific phospholipase C [Pseudohongiella sp.]|nr:Ca2+-dependent phosphoinositide-specific phospholipase C [Pseudohongiella sp.]MDO9521267.1 Ca2+-dependent phosphoinositide-specific phospholipase C [Pseudohongiella sp.]MDP2127276.1 Ca2+-dependent phosphoinositide-specific phospholipase C [Pseudohongiella sp.]